MDSINFFLFSRWKRVRNLGNRYGSVVLARKVDKLIAVKSACVDDSESLKREQIFLKELIDEPYVVRCFGTDESLENGIKTYSLLLEYTDVGNLDHVLIKLCKEKARMDAVRVAQFTRMLLIALSNIHDRGIIHCDLKPANILVFPAADGHPEKVKIADFRVAERGLPPEKARVWATYQYSESDYPQEAEIHPNRKGNTLYSSPETVTKGEYGAHTDVWSLGIIVAEMIRSGVYFHDIGQDLYQQIVHRPLELWRRVPVHFVNSNEAIDFLEKCLARNPAHRWPARRLLRHPFITETLWHHPLASGDDHHIDNPVRPSTDWVDSQGLFTADEDKFKHLTLEFNMAAPCA